ncbi:MAG: stress response translation initiation inhibitor YciH [Candidatus Huberarchaeum crystalense]|uniref:Stress response translation initiation inhibitor YciH n=1 Tax=Huberarchaeum crystalense TaxID=2014257 RepID=A0A2G9LJR1_HUBC1|nr:stress response translation initiation inhibitor YciH [archaeon]OIP20905.1 MAG: hypothetical protein AUJ91_00030 [archaeon CG2_30_31_98]PIN66769.1 MAG: stress response translation initiation inhibitor YciH [Candidatus Huberarchaeum crystalense]NCS98339.1 stress response translation initiation inhibitor YciH [archaeon]PIV13793.1 MAG: stress response translation initiation inhibitor YciH [Candidatus Huberarchaeum crystalense]
MSKICSICGLPEELCVCKKPSTNVQHIIARTEIRQYGKVITIIDGFDKTLDLKGLVRQLKTKFACGGSFDKEKRAIELQGNHTAKIKQELIRMGFSEQNIQLI